MISATWELPVVLIRVLSLEQKLDWCEFKKEQKKLFGNSDYCTGQYFKEFCVKVKKEMGLYL